MSLANRMGASGKNKSVSNIELDKALNVGRRVIPCEKASRDKAHVLVKLKEHTLKKPNK
jgi:hypothetical protein